VDPWGRFQLQEMVRMARVRNDAQFAHEVALINLLGNVLSKNPQPSAAFKPGKELDRG
jgi:hypothetical protein